MSLRTLICLYALVMLLFTSALNCSNTGISGGSTETVNTRIAGVVYMSDGKPAADAVVRLIPAGQNPFSSDIAYFEVKTDTDGSYTFELTDEILSSGHYNLMISYNGLAFYDDSLLVESGSSVEVQPSYLDSTGSITGFLRLQDNSIPDSVYIAVLGTGLHKFFSNGVFTLSSIPAGIYSLRISVPDRSYSFVDTVISITAGVNDTLHDTLLIPWAYLLMENFDDGDYLLLNNRADINEGVNSTWYVFRQNDSTHVYPEAIIDQSQIPQAYIDTGAYSGKSVHVTFMLSDQTNAYAGLGARVAPDGSFVDLRKLTAISFYLKGKGQIRVNFTAQALERYPEDQRWGTWGKIIECPSQWEKIEVLASELVPQEFSAQEADSLMWSEVCDSVGTLHFTTSGIPGDTILMYLDEINFRGVTLEDIELSL